MQISIAAGNWVGCSWAASYTVFDLDGEILLAVQKRKPPIVQELLSSWKSDQRRSIIHPGLRNARNIPSVQDLMQLLVLQGVVDSSVSRPRPQRPYCRSKQVRVL